MYGNLNFEQMLGCRKIHYEMRGKRNFSFIILGVAEYRKFREFADTNATIHTGQGGVTTYEGMEILKSTKPSVLELV
jgi:hypothetical protein